MRMCDRCGSEHDVRLAIINVGGYSNEDFELCAFCRLLFMKNIWNFKHIVEDK